ncbi:hypothetical protein ALI144C_02605 [Actinosynnema sp. ALI-1.44]|uniref:hypothetical protein n=1 Tax=Actinosynnema sp. ALI-1.44 TaxID=1933779 RepID=UPI0009D01C7F|nr:hypothetical protein [Actinosynnema sp. ALI-1.44]ONI90590.1 hypothetical protein ALI144C_02605 [Actinosynnema sp. ALI-1.44]
MPTVTYLADGSHHKEVQAALEKLLDAFGFDVNSRGPHVLGSVFQKTQFRLRKALTSDQITERLLKIERGIELQLVGKAQADVDALQGDAVAKLLTALKDEPTALIQIGSLLLIKADGVPVVRNLTQEELRYLERNPRLLEQPASILRRLAEASQPQPALPPANVS